MTDLPTALEASTPQDRLAESFRAAIAAAPVPVVTFVLIGFNVLAFLARVVAVPSSFLHPTTQQLIAWGADFGPLTLQGQWWRVVSACFLHLSLIHIGMNMFILFQVGLLTEKLFGNVRFFVLYMVAGVGGSVAGLWVHPLIVSAGASGAVFGVYGALLGYLLVQRHVVPAGTAWGIAKSALFFIAFNIVYSLASTEIDMSAHIGGLLTGFVASCALARPITARGQQHHPARALAVAACGTAAAWACMAALAHRPGTPRDAFSAKLTAGTYVELGRGDRVIYSGQATRSEAQALAVALVKAHYFRAPNIVVLLSKDAAGTTVSLLTAEMDASRPTDGTPPRPAFGRRLVPYPWDDPQFLAAAEEIGVLVAPSVGGPPITMAILDRNGAVEKLLPVEARQLNVDPSGSIWYSGSATAHDAQSLAAALKQNNFFQDQDRRVYLSRAADGFTLSFILNDGAWNDPRLTAGIQLLGRKLARSLPGAPLKIRLIDKNMQPRKEISID